MFVFLLTVPAATWFRSPRLLFSRSCRPTHVTASARRDCGHWTLDARNRTRGIHAAVPGISSYCALWDSRRKGNDSAKQETVDCRPENAARRKTERSQEAKLQGCTRCHWRIARRQETFERGKQRTPSAARTRSRRISMPRSLALSLAASTAAQLLHANQPTDPLPRLSTHRLTIYPSPPPCHPIHPRSLVRQYRPPLASSKASPSSLWTAMFANHRQ